MANKQLFIYYFTLGFFYTCSAVAFNMEKNEVCNICSERNNKTTTGLKEACRGKHEGIVYKCPEWPGKFSRKDGF